MSRLTRSQLADGLVSVRARMLEELDRVPPSKIDHPHRDRLALLIALAGERPAQVDDVLRVLWPGASIQTANRSLHRLITTPGIPFFASIDGAKSLGTRRVVRLTPWPSAVEMFGDSSREAG